MACSFVPPIPFVPYHQESASPSFHAYSTMDARATPLFVEPSNFVYHQQPQQPHSNNNSGWLVRSQASSQFLEGPRTQSPQPLAPFQSLNVRKSQPQQLQLQQQQQPNATFRPSHSRTYSGEIKHQRRNSQQQIIPAYEYYNVTSTTSTSSQSRSSSSSSLLSPSSPTSPSPFYSPMGVSSSSNAGADAPMAPVHPSYRGFARTESGLLPIPANYNLVRGEIVMTRTTRRLMKTSSTGRLTARHPCLILESTPTHVRVLQMTSHVHLTAEQVRIVGAQLQHWLAREDSTHKDPFGRPGLVTSPPSDRAGFIWVGDGGEWVLKEHVKYLTGTRVDEYEIQRLEKLADYHAAACPFRPYNEAYL